MPNPYSRPLVFTTNGPRTGKARVEHYQGRRYLVAPVTIMVPGVLNGSEGPLLYPEEHVADRPSKWDGHPVVVYHPKDKEGNHVSASDPGVLDAVGVGFLRNTTYRGRLRTEAWVDEAKARRVDPRVVTALVNGTKMEVSTGLFLDRSETPGSWKGRSYTHITRNYVPDHLALLPDQVGACSIRDGCGLFVNSSGRLTVKTLWTPILAVNATSTVSAERPTANAGCGCNSCKSGKACPCVSWESVTALEPVGNKKRRPPSAADVTPEKACKILKDGTANGRPLTKKQRGMFGAICGERGTRNVSADGWEPIANCGGDMPAMTSSYGGFDGSLMAVQSTVQQAFREEFPPKYDPDTGMAINPATLVTVFPHYVVYRKGENLMRMPFTVDDYGEVTFEGRGEPVRRVVSWESVPA